MATKGFLAVHAVMGMGGLALSLLAMIALSPQALGPLGVTVWFFLLLIGLTGIFILMAYTVQVKLQPKLKPRQYRSNATRRGLFIAGYITVLLALSSLQQLNVRDGLLLLLLLGLAEFYMVARS